MLAYILFFTPSFPSFFRRLHASPGHLFPAEEGTGSDKLRPNLLHNFRASGQPRRMRGIVSRDFRLRGCGAREGRPQTSLRRQELCAGEVPYGHRFG